MKWALTREEELVRRARSREDLPHSQSSMSKGRRAKSAQFGGTRRNSMGQSPAMATSHTGLHPVGKEEPTADFGKDHFSSSTEDNLHQTSADNTDLAKSSFNSLGVFGGNYFSFLQDGKITDHFLMFLSPPFFNICHPVAKLVSSFKILGKGLLWWSSG